MAIYLRFGNVTADGTRGQITVLAKTFDLSISREVTMGETGKLSVGEFSGAVTITKAADRSMTALLKEALAAGETVTLTIVYTRDRVREVLSYKLANCTLNDYAISPGDADIPIETLELGFSVIDSDIRHSRRRQG